MRPPRLLSWLTAVALAGSISPATARAQEPQPAQPPVPSLTMPVVKRNEGAVYPKAALDAGIHETVEVPLVLTVDATGVVTRAEVEKSVGHGFDEAAVAAARRLLFDPALRDGKPVPARIRFVYRFSPPPSVLSGRVVTEVGERPIAGATVTVRDAAGVQHAATTGADGNWRIEGLPAGTYHVHIEAMGRAPHEADETVQAGEEASAIDRLSPAPAATTAPAAGAEKEEPVEQVEVHAEKPPREVAKRTLEEREIDRIPGTNGDALRSLQNLPGVARPPPLSGLLIVRGSAPADTQYFVDGTPVPIVYHFGGLSSIVPTPMLNRIDFYPGNFSTQYGRAMGGIVDVGLVDPKSDRLHVAAQTDLIEASAMAQGPLFDSGWRFAVSARRSTIDAWIGSALKATGSGVSVTPVYYDYQAVAERDIGKHSSIRFAVFGSDDKIDVFSPVASESTPDLAGVISSHTGFWRAQALYKTALTPSNELRFVAALGEDYIKLNAGNIFIDLTQWEFPARLELSNKLSRDLTLDLGVDYLQTQYSISAQLPQPPKAGQPPAGPFDTTPPVNTTGTGAVFEPAVYAELEATPWRGARIVPGIRVDYTKDTGAWDLSPRIVVRQDITGLSGDEPRTTLKAGVGLFTQPPQVNQTNAVFGTPGLVSNRAYHYDVGVERQVMDHVTASLDGFYKQLDDLVEQGLGNTGSGDVIGAETLIRYSPDERFFGWIAYTLSRSERRPAPSQPLRLFQYDETHILTVLGSYRIGRGWELGMRYRLTSGYMYTPNTYGFYDENVGTYLPLSAYPPSSSRLPLFHSLDVRVDKTWAFPWGTLGAYLDVLNIYNQGNVDGISYDYNFTHSTPANYLPIIPSIGLRVEH
jgi:TonB family protein